MADATQYPTLPEITPEMVVQGIQKAAAKHFDLLNYGAAPLQPPQLFIYGIQGAVREFLENNKHEILQLVSKELANRLAGAGEKS